MMIVPFLSLSSFLHLLNIHDDGFELFFELRNDSPGTPGPE
jgi:hypothetical protein